MMGCLKKYLHHKSVYIKIKYYLLMIGEFSQDDTVVMINIIYTYLNSEDSEQSAVKLTDALLKLTDGVTENVILSVDSVA